MYDKNEIVPILQSAKILQRIIRDKNEIADTHKNLYVLQRITYILRVFMYDLRIKRTLRVI